jgi:hypothetical protein
MCAPVQEGRFPYHICTCETSGVRACLTSRGYRCQTSRVGARETPRSRPRWAAASGVAEWSQGDRGAFGPDPGEVLLRPVARALTSARAKLVLGCDWPWAVAQGPQSRTGVGVAHARRQTRTDVVGIAHARRGDMDGRYFVGCRRRLRGRSTLGPTRLAGAAWQEQRYERMSRAPWWGDRCAAVHQPPRLTQRLRTTCRTAQTSSSRSTSKSQVPVRAVRPEG